MQFAQNKDYSHYFKYIQEIW